jgi:competence protein ComGC
MKEFKRLPMYLREEKGYTKVETLVVVSLWIAMCIILYISGS